VSLFLATRELYDCTYYFKEGASPARASEAAQNPQTKRLLAGKLPFLNYKTICKLLKSGDTIVFHLPSLPIFAILVGHSLTAPYARRYVYWHAFLGYPESPILDKLARLYEKLVFAFCVITKTQVITTSPVLEKEIRGRNNKLRVHVVSPVLPGETAHQAKDEKSTQSARTASNKPFRICYVGRLATYKRPEWLIDALPGLPVDIILEVVGDGPCRKSLEKRVKDLELKGRVTFHGLSDDETKLKIIADSDVLCLPSYSCNEAFGIVQLEAMCMGVPPLAFSLPRSGVEWVGNLKSLLPFEKIDNENILEVIMYLYENPSLQRQLSSYSLARYRELFSRDAWERSLEFLVTEP
jgi:glycosyltransferase involved in cell wall biosynthesis